MASINHIFLGILILQIYVHAAPSDESKVEDIAKEELTDENLHSTPIDHADSTISTENPRQKRYFNPIPYDYSFRGINDPDYYRRADIPGLGYFRGDEAFAEIHKRVQDIVNIVRQPPLPPIPPIHHLPVFYPVFVVPPTGCACNPNKPQTTTSPDNNNQLPNVNNRVGEMEDERQNWGLVVNETVTNRPRGQDNRQAEDDFSRPISFDPIMLDIPNVRPPPPVEHGTEQGSSTGSQTPPQFDENTPTQPSGFSSPGFSPEPQRPSFNPAQPSTPVPQNGPQNGLPNRCDTAILMCCHQPQVMYSCFTNQECSDLVTYGNPCNTNAILTVIDKYQRFYGTKSG